jgi:hypothetical protein
MKNPPLVLLSLSVCLSWCMPAARAQGVDTSPLAVPSTAVIATAQSAAQSTKSGTQFITSVRVGTLHSHFSGWAGMQIRVSSNPLNLTAVCRYVMTGNTQSHTVELVSNGVVLKGSAASVKTSGVTPGSFACSHLASGITLNANTSYLVLSQEIAGGDAWGDYHTVVSNTGDAEVTNTASSSDNARFNVFSPANPHHDMVPVGFLYTVLSPEPPPPASISVSISPTSASLPVGQSKQFSATVSGTTNNTVNWLVNGTQGGSPTLGTISSSGLYTAPSAVPAGAVTVTAQSAAQASATASAAVTVTAAPTPITVTISPTSTSVTVSQSKQFSATVSGTTNNTVNWLVNGTQGGNATVGTISSAGLYQAPASVPSGTVTVTAESQAQSTATANATVSVTPAPIMVSISPTNPSLQLGQTLQFSATVSGTSNPAVDWLVSNVQGGNTLLGTVSATGLYTAPASVPGTAVTVTAESVANPSVSASTSVTIAAPVVHQVTLSWSASVSSAIAGYNVYRGVQAAGPFTKLNSSLDTATVYTDSTVVAGQTYYYATTAVDSNGVESGYSNVVQAVIP